MTGVDWSFGGLWPYEPCYAQTADGRLHYVDEGPRDGPVTVLLHGNATWGFLYRSFIAPLLAAGQRVVVPDHLGFGRSDKPGDPAVYRLDRHIDRLAQLLDALDVRNVTLVFAEWGAAIGLGWAVLRPDRVARLFVMNSPFPERPSGRVRLPPPIYLFRLPVLGDIMVKGLGAFTKGFLFKVGMVHRERLTPTIKAAYLAPHPTWTSRTGVLAFPRQIPTGPDDLAATLGAAAQETLRGELGDRPARIVWAMRDVSFSESVLEQWTGLLPHATVTRIEDAGHCLQEDAPERIIPTLADFVSGS